jgi:predicted protein tyrosine phosphatase
MKIKNYLFVCKHNFTRSKYAAEFFRGFLDGEKKKGNVYSVGTGFISHFLGKRVNKKILSKMDLVFVMEKYMKDLIVKNFEFDKNKIVVLNIKDNYGYFSRKGFKDLDKIFKRIKWNTYL